MDTRRAFLRQLAATGVLSSAATAARPGGAEPDAQPKGDRGYWVATLRRVVEPVLESLAADRLRQLMPVECPAGKVEERRVVTHLESVGRTLAGLAPWLELPAKGGAEAAEGTRLLALAQAGLARATDPAAADLLSFTAGPQCLVDAAFLSHALLRAPRTLWQGLDSTVQERLLRSLASTRAIKPGNNNWLLFSAMVEAFLSSAGAAWEAGPVETALSAHESWYKGDGAYGDGPEFHWDYYNSYVIHPMLIDVVEQMARVSPRWTSLREGVLARARRYAAVQERLIAPDGSFPPLGRSIAYRCGAFQLLAQMALRRQLPEGMPPPQVRSALTAVIRRTLDATGTFDANGWLTIGLAGHQPSLAEGYISTGSLYLCTLAFLPLGLPAEDPFWAGPATDWTSRCIWAGKDEAADHALKT